MSAKSYINIKHFNNLLGVLFKLSGFNFFKKSLLLSIETFVTKFRKINRIQLNNCLIYLLGG